MPIKKPKPGFTLVELLIVITIIGLLAAIAVLLINPLEKMRRARNAIRLNDISFIARALEAHYIIYGSFPEEHWYDTSRGCTTTDPGVDWWEDVAFDNDWSDGSVDCVGETLDIQLSSDPIPKDPINKDYQVYGYNAVRTPSGPQNRPYIGYSIEAFFEGKGTYRICGGDFQGTWMDSETFCGISNPLP
jgi:prepilin-type N-terminal cleavage/methylation domain-containing protein